jgi:hypothetical protein
MVAGAVTDIWNCALTSMLHPSSTTRQRLFPSDTVVFEKESELVIRVHVFRCGGAAGRVALVV